MAATVMCVREVKNVAVLAAERQCTVVVLDHEVVEQAAPVNAIDVDKS
jgi:hypothetical protein